MMNSGINDLHKQIQEIQSFLKDREDEIDYNIIYE